MTRILFVCLGNICRSAMAEFIMKDLIGVSVDLTAGDQTEQAHTQTCCDEERFELHRITPVFSRITGFSRSKLEREPFFIGMSYC